MKNKKKLLGILAGLSIVAFGTYIINKLVFFYSTIKDVLSKDRSHIYHWRFGHIHYSVSGEGTPILLVHDLNHLSSGYEWNALVDRLSSSYTVYVIDLLGCGVSEKLKITYTNYLYVQLLNDFIKEVIKSKTDVIASRSASSLAVMACQTEPMLYHRLLFINPDSMNSIAKYPKANHKALKWLVELPLIGTSVYNCVSSKRYIRRRFESKYFADPKKVEQKDIEAFYEAAHLGSASARYLLASVRSHFTNIHISNAIKQLDHSMFIIGGDQVAGIDEIIDSYVTLNPAIEAACIEETKYLSHMEAPDAVYELCSIFFNTI